MEIALVPLHVESARTPWQCEKGSLLITSGCSFLPDSSRKFFPSLHDNVKACYCYFLHSRVAYSVTFIFNVPDQEHLSGTHCIEGLCGFLLI